MRLLFLITFSCLLFTSSLFAQKIANEEKHRQAIHALIDDYSKARESKDTVALKKILTPDIDQLVSTGQWRRGIRESVDGMKRSSESNPGSRRLIVDKIRFLNEESAIVDARYEIQNPDGTIRKMWSTFIVLYENNQWKISAIRNMLPTDSQ